MAIYGIEWIAIAVVIIVLFVYGPEKLPKIARAIGLARREYEKGAKGAHEEAHAQPSGTEIMDDELLKAAKALGIETKGKSRKEIAEELERKAKQLSSP